MKINYFSDIHLEFGPQDLPDNDADLVIAAGDMGLAQQGVEWLKQLDRPVIYVAGNHEFYAQEYHEALAGLRQNCAVAGIHFLEQDIWVWRNVRFVGCTLWADILADGPDKADNLSLSLNDFRKILYSHQPFDVENFHSLHQRSRAWLESQLAQPFPGKTVVITHHAPSEWSWNDSPKALKKLAYCSDLKFLLHEYEITAWFHGHIHSAADYRVAGARILCNPRGYVGRKLVDKFDINRIVEI